MIIRINPDNPQQRLIDKVVEVLRNGGVIAYPTDTHYGIGCDLHQKKAIEKIIRFKKRDPKKPFSFVCADLKDISQYAKVSNYGYRTMRRLLPGPYTFILTCTRLVPKIILSNSREAGIRVPDHKICQSLLQTLGNPLLNTTAGKSSEEIFTDPAEIEANAGGIIDLVVDGGPVPEGNSTMVSLIDDTPVIIREGLGPIDNL